INMSWPLFTGKGGEKYEKGQYFNYITGNNLLKLFCLLHLYYKIHKKGDNYMKKKLVAGASVVVLAASMFGFAQVFAGGSGQDSGGETQKEMKGAPKVEKVEKETEKKSQKDTKKSTKPALLKLVD